MAWLYGIQSGLFIKIGVTGNIPTRLKQMNLYNPHPCKVVMRRRVAEAYTVERRLHKVLAPYSVGREWFTVDVRLLRAAAKVVIDDVQRERVDWQIECARRLREKESAGGLHVESATVKN